MHMFRPKTLEILTEDRVQSLKMFSDKALPVINRHVPGVEFLIDVLMEEQLAWNALEDDHSTRDLVLPTVSKGGLSFIAACMAEGQDVRGKWELISECYDDEFEKDLVTFGLHGIHFRMNLKNPSDRIDYTCKLANLMFDRGSNASRLGTVPITGYSLLSERLDDAIEWYLGRGDVTENGYIGFSAGDIRALCGLTDKTSQSIDEKQAFRQLLLKMIFNTDTLQHMQSWDIAIKVQNALLPLVYNYGYKLKASGLPGHEVLAKASSRIDSLLSFLPATSEFLKALERQILINLFSAFPEDLEMLSAQPEELQGVMLNPVLLKEPMARFFSKTLAGPMALFSPRYSAPASHRGTQIVSFFNATPYPLHLDIAVRGYMLDRQEMVYLAENCPGRSSGVEQILLDDSLAFDPPMGLVKYLSQPEQLKEYSDPAVLKLIEHLIIGDVAKSHRDKGVPVKTPSVAPVLSERPHLVEPIIKILEDQDCLNATMFEWCGFGVKELKALGKRAPSELKGLLLEESLGF